MTNPVPFDHHGPSATGSDHFRSGGHATHRRAMLAGMAGVAAGALLTRGAKAGPLDPPAGPVAPTPGPEPRIPLNQTTAPGDASAVLRITQPGSYYLTGPVMGAAGKSGIIISVDNVAIDLMGYEVVGVTGALVGIGSETARSGVTIRNGFVRNWPFSGVFFGVVGTRNQIIESVVASANGQNGFTLGQQAVVRDCAAMDNEGTGFSTSSGSVVTGCVAYSNARGFSGGGTVFQYCAAEGNTAEGISVFNGGVASNCSATENTANGFSVSNGSVVDCSAYANSVGISASVWSLVARNSCAANGLSGIRVLSQRNRIESNTCTGNAVGIDVQGTNNLLIGNTCGGNSGANWTVAAGNAIQVIVAGVSGGFAGNSGGGPFGASNPHANFTF